MKIKSFLEVYIFLACTESTSCAKRAFGLTGRSGGTERERGMRDPQTTQPVTHHPDGSGEGNGGWMG